MNFINEQVFAHGPWDYFEKSIARFLIHKGWENVEHVGGTGDKGADIIATKKGEDHVFQVKYSQSTNSLSVEIVDDVVRAMEFYQIDKGVCVSNRVLGPTQSQKLQTYKDSGYQISSFTADTLLRAVEKMDIWINEMWGNGK